MQATRKTLIATAALCLTALCALPAHADKRKISGTATAVVQPQRAVIFSAENPKREISQSVTVWHWFSSDPDWDGIVETAGDQALDVAGAGLHNGYITFSHKNGDTSHGSYSGTHKIIDKGNGAWESPFEGQKLLTGGTGKFSKLKGVIRYKGNVTPGSNTFNWEGEIEY